MRAFPTAKVTRLRGEPVEQQLNAALTGDVWEPFPLEALLSGPDGGPLA